MQASEIPMYVCGHVPDLLAKTTQRMQALGFRPKAVASVKTQDPVKGCIDAHGMMAAAAEADGNSWYVGIEQNVEATDHFCLRTIQDAIAALTELQLDVVMLSTLTLPFYFFNRRAQRINQSVWKKSAPTCERSQAAVYRTAFALRLARQEYKPRTVGNAWDWLILPQYVTYKAPFKRTAGTSTTTPQNNAGFNYRRQQFMNNYSSFLEDLMHYQISSLMLVLFLIVVVVVVYRHF